MIRTIEQLKYLRFSSQQICVENFGVYQQVPF